MWVLQIERSFQKSFRFLNAKTSRQVADFIAKYKDGMEDPFVLNFGQGDRSIFGCLLDGGKRQNKSVAFLASGLKSELVCFPRQKSDLV